MADDLGQLYGDYSSSPDSRYASTPYEGLKSAASNTILAKGCNDVECNTYNANEIKNATLAADVVIVCLGTGK